MLYAILCYNSEEVVRSWSKEEDDAVMTRTLALVDGEHYPSTVRDALAELPHEFVGAFLVGGTEKLRADADYGVPLVDDLEIALRELEPELVLDLSDEPVLGPVARFRLASLVLAAGIPYAGADFRFEPPHYASMDPSLPSIAGTLFSRSMLKTRFAATSGSCSSAFGWVRGTSEPSGM